MKKILIADDRASSRELIRTLLEYSGYEVHEAEDGQDAVEKALAIVPDLILLDIQMPCLDGYGAVQAMRREEGLRNLPIVALTASAMHTDRERVLNAGFTAYVTKPVTLKRLREEVGRLLL